MHIQYGPCHLNVVKTNYYRREAVLDEAGGLLYVRHTLSVRATFNPATQIDRVAGRDRPSMSFTVQPNPALPGPLMGTEGPYLSGGVGPPYVSPAFVPDLTNAAVHTAEAVKAVLMQPRLLLHVQSGGGTLLVSPQPGFVSDANNGPKPLSCDVVEMSSPKTFAVDFVVQTDVSEAPLYTTHPSPILSHTWKEFHDLDSNFMLVRRVEGKVIFNAAMIRTPGLFDAEATGADYFRGVFMHPIPSGMKRESLSVGIDNSGTEVTYSFADRETAYRVHDPKGILTNVEAHHTIEGGSPGHAAASSLLGKTMSLSGSGMGLLAEQGGKYAGVLKYGGLALSALGGLASAASSPALVGDFGAWIGGRWVGGWASAAAQWASLGTHTVTVALSGHRRATRDDLEKIAYQMIRARLQKALNFFGGRWLVGWKVTFNLKDVLLEATSTWRVGHYAATADDIHPLPHMETRQAAFPEYDDPLEELPPFIEVTGEHTAIRSGLEAGRGWRLEQLVAAQLSRPHDDNNRYPQAPDLLDMPESPLFLPPNWPKPAPSSGE